MKFFDHIYWSFNKHFCLYFRGCR